MYRLKKSIAGSEVTHEIRSCISSIIKLTDLMYSKLDNQTFSLGSDGTRWDSSTEETTDSSTYKGLIAVILSF